MAPVPASAYSGLHARSAADCMVPDADSKTGRKSFWASVSGYHGIDSFLHVLGSLFRPQILKIARPTRKNSEVKKKLKNLAEKFFRPVLESSRHVLNTMLQSVGRFSALCELVFSFCSSVGS